MKLNLHLNNHRPLQFILIICCCLVIFISSSFALPPLDTSKPLEILALNQETQPVFYLTSQLSYSHSWFTEPSPLASFTPLTEPSLSYVNSVLPTNETDDTLNFLLTLGKTKPNYTQIAEDLSKLSQYFSEISLSVLPSDSMTDQDYLEQYELLYSVLNEKQLSSISMIAYPPTTTELSLYNRNSVAYVGTVLRRQADLETLHQIYQYFYNKKPLVVRDEIKTFYTNDAEVAAREITASYYMLAVNYPDIEMIFSPYVAPPIPYEDSYVLSSSDVNFNLFNIIYSRLLSKPWLTTSTKTVSKLSPYEPLQDYDIITGTTELILSPDATVLHQLETLEPKHYSLYFKWNNELLNLNLSYPYSIIIDTQNQPSGVSRLYVVLQDNKTQARQSYAIDLTINHTSDSKRAQRITKDIKIHSTYTKPNKTYIPILMYHTIEDTVLPENQNSHVETAVFESQMSALLENGYTPINFYDLKNYSAGLIELPDHPIIITMDDGYLNNYTNAYPIYKKYNIEATLFVSPYYMKPENTERHFGWLAAKEMEDSGLIDIQPHGYDHTPLPYLSLRDVKYHTLLAKGLIEMNLGPRDVSVLAYPQFRHNRHTVRLLNNLGFDFQITNLATEGTVLSPKADFSPPKLKRINVPNTMSPDELIAILNNLTS